MELGYGKVTQLRTIDGSVASKEYNRINAGLIPALDASGAESDIQSVLDNKLSKLTGDLRYAKIEGNELNTFMVASASANNQAVPKGDMDTAILAHSNRTDNPHHVTKGIIGLSDVNNTSDINKPISSATQDALDTKLDATHGNDASNPHAVTAVQVGALPITGGDTTGDIYVNGNLVYHAGNLPPLSTLIARISALEAKLND